MDNRIAFLGDGVTLRTSPGPIFRITDFDIRRARARISWSDDEAYSFNVWVPVTTLVAVSLAGFQYYPKGRSLVPDNRRKFK